MSTSGQFRTLHTCFLARTAICSSICVALTAVTSQSAMRVFVCLLWVLAGIPLETHSVGVRKRVKDAEEKSSTPAEHTEVSGAGKRGGVRQRLESSSSISQSSSELRIEHQRELQLPLIQNLKADWARGIITSKQVHRYALSALHQGAAGLDRIASMGNRGENPQHLFQALVNYFGTPLGAPSIYWIELPTADGPKTPHPLIWPHKFFSLFFSERSEDFGKAISGPDGACLQFWQSMRHTQFVQKHPDLLESSWAKTVPLGMHGDAGAFSHDSLFVISWNSLMGTGPTIAKRFVFTVIKKSGMRADTLDEILKIFAQSFNILLSGKDPDTNQPLANGWRGALCQVRGDWQFYCQVRAS